jgi:uncharacterized MAPEG superfamily protein
MSELPLLPPIAALVLFGVWAMLLAISVVAWRLSQVITGTVPEGGFNPGAPHGGDAYWRLNRAHINALENLPLFATVVLSGLYLQVQDPLFPLLANVVIVARVAQTLIHISSGAAAVVLMRFTAFGVQVLSMLAMAAMDLNAAGVSLPVPS